MGRRPAALRFPRSSRVLAGLAILIGFAALALIGAQLTPYGPNETDREHWVRHVCVVPGCPVDPVVHRVLVYPQPLPPSLEHPLGTTVFAQDVLAQLLAASRATLLVGLLAGAIATGLAIVIGVTAGYLGGAGDEGLSLLSNVFLAIPGLPLLIVLAQYVPGTGTSVIVVAVIVALTGWAYGARVLRAQTLSLRNRDFVEAARVSGERSVRVIAAEVLPNLLPIVASSFLFTSLYAVSAYIALAFLGLAGSPTSYPPGPWNWGEMLREAYSQNAVASGWWWWWAPPGICVALLGTGLALVNFGVDEFVNPRLRRAGLTRKAARRLGTSVRAVRDLTPVVRAAAPDLAPAVAADVLLDVRGLSVDYGLGAAPLPALVDCTLTLRHGSLLGLAGESGSGKSTLALALLRLLPPPAVITAGQAWLHLPEREPVDLLGADAEELRSLRWSEVSVVLQSALNALNPVMTIEAQFDDLLHVHRPQLSPADRRTRAGELLELVGVGARRLRGYPHELSGGMRQRAVIAMALALDPKLMILDEPTTALDVVKQREILQQLERLRQRFGFAALFITHDLSLLVEVADEIAVMYAGRVMERAPAASLYHAPRLPYTYGLLNCFPPLRGARKLMEGIPGSPPSLAAQPGGCPFHPRCRWALDRCRVAMPALRPVDGGGREVACWLHAEGATPPELALPAPVAALGGPG
jgi:peptide/nickel transport system permease protein